MNTANVFLGNAVKLRVAKDAIDIYDLVDGVMVYRCSLTLDAEQAGALIAALQLVHAS